MRFKLIVKGKIYDFIGAFLNYKNKDFKIYEKEYENQFNDYRDEDEEEEKSLLVKG